ncbi:d-Galf:alpha-d-Glc beta-1,6-galactofuranosyltransferase [Escherichia coli]|nr:d-Galf:alpha-d-Glc beta-1,6-galactofuranosyltransferase [Escherichia coli]
MYFLNDLNFSRRDAGFKARKDALDIASDYENISVVNIPLWGGVVQRIISSVKLSTFLCGLENKDVLIFNFPMAKPFWHILSFFHRLLKFRIVPLIHDIDELRGGGGSDSVRLATCDMVISHNPQMTKYLSKYMSQDKIKDIKIFDYLVSSDVEHRDVTDKQRGSYMLATFLGINVLSYILKDAILLSLVSTMKIKIILNILEVLMLNLRKRLTSQACNLDSFGMEILSKPVVVPLATI